MRPLRVAVWGLGRHAINKILPAISVANGLELCGVCSRNPTSVASCAEQWGCKGWIDPAAMLLDPLVDVIYVATPIGLHYEHGKRVLDAGKHFWCEKPLTCRLENTRELLQLSRDKGLTVCEGHMYLHHPQFEQLSRYVRDGRLGSIVSISCRFGIPRLENPGFRSDPALGGGALFDVGCYPISAIQALFSDVMLDVRCSSVLVRDGAAIDTDGEAVIHLSNGVTAFLEWRINCSYRNEMDIWGEKGSVFADRIFSKLHTHVPVFRFRDGQGVETTEYGEAADHFVLMLQHFRSTVFDLNESEKQRQSIAQRAEVLDRIWSGNQR
jgi:NDP-hexose-3-ketoreductase